MPVESVWIIDSSVEDTGRASSIERTLSGIDVDLEPGEATAPVNTELGVQAPSTRVRHEHDACLAILRQENL